MELHFTSLGAPTDPAYLRFVEGAKLHISDADDAYRWRWRPTDGVWRYYLEAKWSLDPSGLPITGSPVEQDYDSFPRKSYKLETAYLDKVFRELHGAYVAMSGRHPSAVWALLTGQWFTPFSKTTIPGAGSTVGLPQAALDRIARVKAFRDNGSITPDYAQQLINQIVAEYT
jgi:hypothetical protein